jgi:tRNA(Met) C34 N-acetyltransferase TmcA
MIRALNSSDQVSLPQEIKDKALENSQEGWVNAYTADFRRRLASLLGYEFRKIHAGLCLAMLSSKNVLNQA